MSIPYEEGINQLHGAIKQFIGQHNHDKRFQDYLMAGAIKLDLRRLKIAKLGALQYKFNAEYEKYLKNFINDPETKALPEKEREQAKWPIEFFPDQRKKENLKKGITHIHFLLPLIQAWWTETNYYEHVEEAAQLFNLNINQVYFLMIKYLAKIRTTEWNQAQHNGNAQEALRRRQEVPAWGEIYDEEYNKNYKEVEAEWKQYQKDKRFPIAPILNVGTGENFNYGNLTMTLNVNEKNNNVNSISRGTIEAVPGNRGIMAAMAHQELWFTFNKEFADTFLEWYMPPEWEFHFELHLQLAELTATDENHKQLLIPLPELVEYQVPLLLSNDGDNPQAVVVDNTIAFLFHSKAELKNPIKMTDVIKSKVAFQKKKQEFFQQQQQQQKQAMMTRRAAEQAKILEKRLTVIKRKEKRDKRKL